MEFHFPLSFRPLEGFNTLPSRDSVLNFRQPYLSKRAANLPYLTWNLVPVYSSNLSMFTGRVFFPGFSKWFEREMGFYAPLIPTREPGLFLGRPPFASPGWARCSSMNTFVFSRTTASFSESLLGFPDWQVDNFIFIPFFPFPGGILDSSVSGGRAGLSLSQWLKLLIPFAPLYRL